MLTNRGSLEGRYESARRDLSSADPATILRSVRSFPADVLGDLLLEGYLVTVSEPRKRRHNIPVVDRRLTTRHGQYQRAGAVASQTCVGMSSSADENLEMGPLLRSVTTQRQRLGGVQGLLESGIFSDVLVRCGTREWRLHKAIICPHSAYFERAFCGEFLESQTNTIVLRDLDADKVDWVVKFLYMKQCATEQLSDPMLFHVTCVQLYELGDYFDIAALRSYAFDQLRTHLHAKAIEIQRAFAAFGGERAEPGCDFVPDAFLEALFRGIEAAFREGAACEPVQREYVFFIRHTRYWLLADEKMQNYLGRAPGFAVALLREVLDSRLWAELGALPDRCSQCGRAPLEEQDGGHWGFHCVTLEEGVVGDCNVCAPECHSPCRRCRDQEHREREVDVVVEKVSNRDEGA